MGNAGKTKFVQFRQALLLLPILILGLFPLMSGAQTVHISSAGDGGFNNGSTFAANGWQVSNASINQWVVGTAVNSGAITGNSAYISNNNGATANYDIFSPGICYFYRDVTIPAGESVINLSYNWRGTGEAGWDIVQVFLVPTTTTPTASTTYPGGGATFIPPALTDAVLVASHATNITTQSASHTLSGALAGTSFRLVFAWKSDDSFGSNPPLAIDNINLTSRAPITPANAPLNFSATAITASTMTISWDDNTTDEVNFKVYRSSNNIDFTLVDTKTSTSVATTGTTYSSNLTGLIPGTQYYFRIVAAAEFESPALEGTATTIAGNTITSTSSGGLWSQPSTWVGNSVPTNLDNVIIADGATVTIDQTTATCLNLTVGQGGAAVLQYAGAVTNATLTVANNVTVSENAIFTAYNGTGTKILNIGGTSTAISASGSLIVEGTFNMATSTTNFVQVNFSGSSTGSISGSGPECNFRAITVNKGAGATLNVDRTITQLAPTAAGTYLTLTSGIFKINAPVSLTPYFGAQTITAANGTLWLNHASANVSSVGAGTTTGTGNLTSTGTLRIDNGSFSYGSGANSLSFGSATSKLIMNGGTLNANGTVSFANNTGTLFEMNGGDLVIDVQVAANATAAGFSIGASTSVNWTGGMITIVDPHATSGTTSFTMPYSTNKIVTGGTLRLGDGVSGTTGATGNTGGFGVSFNLLHNLIVDNRVDLSTTRMVRMIGNGFAGGSIDIRPNAYVFLGSGTTTATLVSNGPSFNNDGVVAGTQPGGTQAIGTIQFSSLTGNQSLTGSGTFESINTLSLASASTLTFNQVNQLVVNRLNFFRGSVANTNKLTVGLGGTTTSVIQRGGIPDQPAPVFDNLPTFNIGTGGLGVVYAPSLGSITTGAEIPATRSIASFAVINVNGVTLEGGPLTTIALVFNADNPGLLNTSAANTIRVTGTITAASANSYVRGPMEWEIPASTSNADILFPVGKGTYNPVQLVGTNTNAGGAVVIRAEVFDADAGGTAGTMLSSIKTNRYWNTEIISGDVNFSSANVRLYDTPDGADAIGASTTASGTYNYAGAYPAVIAPNSILTGGTGLTSLPGYFVMANLEKPEFTSVTMTPDGNQCTNVVRTIVADVTPGGAPLATVFLYYSVNGGDPVLVNMVNTIDNIWVADIPAVTPNDAIVSWFIEATDDSGLLSIYTGTPYRDAVIENSGLTVTASSATICSGSETVLTGVISGLGSTYCSPVFIGSDENSGDYINNFSFANITNNNSGDAPSDYTYYSNLTANVVAGNSYSVSLTAGGTESLYAQYFSVWIDFNQNGTFEASERVFASPAATFAPTASTGTIEIPANAFNGETRMRVIGKYGSAPTTAESCEINSAWGEAEDYNVIITGGENNQYSPVGYSWNDGTEEVGIVNPLSVYPTSTTDYTLTVTYANGCTKTSAPFTVNTLVLPSGPTSAVGSTQCGNGVPNAFATGGLPGQYKWYLTETGGTALPGENLQELQNYSISETTTFYVALYDGTCESERVAITANVTTPDAVQANVSSTEVCQFAEIDLSVVQTGSSNEYVYTWSASPSAGSGLTGTPNDTELSVSPDVAGEYTYTVTAVDAVANCVTSSSVTVTVNNSVTDINITATPTTPCTGGTTNLEVTMNSGTPSPVNLIMGFETTDPINEWTFLNNSDGNPWQLADASHSGDFALVYEYSSIADADVWAFSPIKTLTAGITYNISFWYRAELAAYPEKFKVTVGNTATPAAHTTILWNNGGLPITNSTYMQGTTTFTPTVTGNYTFGFNCFSDADQYLFWLDDISITGPGVADPTFVWTSVPGGLNSTVQNPTNVLVSEPTTFTVTITNANGCTNTGSLLVTPLDLPEDPIATDAEHCGVAVSSALVLSGGVNGNGTFNWYDAPTGGTLLQSSTSISYLQPISTTTILYVSEMGVNGCESRRSPVAITVIEADPLNLSVSDNSICIGEAITLTSTQVGSNNTYELSWSSSAGSGLNGDEYEAAITITPTASGIYTYTVAGYDADKGCNISATIDVTVNALPVVTNASATPAITCASGTVTLDANSIPAPISGTIGTATTVNTTSSYPSPFGTYWGNTRSQYLIRASELASGGLTPGYIYSVSFDVVTVGSPSQLSGYTMKVGTTAIETITATITDPTTTVFGPVDYSPTVGINTLNFATPIYWDGTSNLFVEICFNNLLIGSSNTIARLSSTSYTSSAYVGNDNTSGSICGLALTNGSAGRPNMIFQGYVNPDPTSTYTYTWNPGNLIGKTIPVNPTTNTTYSVVATNPSTGCTSLPLEVDVEIVPLGVEASASVTTSCAGGDVILNVAATGGAPFVYSWSNGVTTISSAQSLTVNPTETTTYTVSVTDICGNIMSDEVTVTVNTIPTASIDEAGAPISLCYPATQVLNASTGTASPAYQWNLNGVAIAGANDADYEVTASGNYSVVITNTETGCSAESAALTVMINPLPAFTLTVPTDLCEGNSADLVANSIVVADGTVVSGTGTTTSSATGISPYSFGYEAARSQYLIRADELQALNLAAGDLTSLAFFVTSGNTGIMKNYTIKLSHTTSTTLGTAFEAASFTTVFGPQDYATGTTANDWRTHNFTTPFTWDGTSNIIVEVCFENDVDGSCGTCWGSTSTVRYTATAYNSVYGRYVDNAAACGVTTFGFAASNRTNRPNMRFGGKVTTDVTESLNWLWTPGGQTTSTITVAPDVTTDYSVVATNPVTGCVSEVSEFTINVSAPLSVGATIDGPTNATAHTTGLSLATYTIATTNEASIVWNIPAGSTNVTGQGTNAISFYYPSSYGGGSISVTVEGNPGCEPITRTLAITYDCPTAPVVIGNTNICHYVGNGTEVVYTVEPDPAVSSYIWTVSNNMTIVSGQGTPSITVTFENGFIQQTVKRIYVRGVSGCGQTAQTIFYLHAQYPSSAGAITGPDDVCSYVGTSNLATYSIEDVRSAESYLWTVPAGATIVSGQGTTNIEVSFDNSYATGGITVYAINSCGTSTPRTLIVKRTSPSTPSPISGPTSVCGFMPNPSSPAGLEATYSVSAAANVNYVWSVPSGATITGGQGTNSITVLFDNTYTTGGISVYATSSCGVSATRNLNLSRLNPSAPSVIDVTELGGCPERMVEYSLSLGVPGGATWVEWTVPAGATIMSGQGTSTIVVSYSSAAVTGEVTATGVNGCGTSSSRKLKVKLAACETDNIPMVKGDAGAEVKGLQLDVNVFPNPSTDLFNILAKSSDNKTRIVVRIMDNLGRVMESHNMQSGETLQAGRRLKAGSYFVEVIQGKERVTRKVIKF